MLKLAIDRLSLSYGPVDVLKEISLEFNEPGIVGIIGPNGAGKSTLLKCINNILRPQEGGVRYGNRNTRAMTAFEIAQKFGYVPQEFPVTFLSTVIDTVLMGRRPFTSWRTGSRDMEIAVDALKMLDLEDVALRSISELSGGQLQRVMIARAIAQQSEIMLLDEPTSKLDIRHQLEVMDIIRTLADERDLISIVVMHDLNLASRYADKIVVMKSGQVAFSGEPEKVLTTDNIRHVYGVDATVILDENCPYIIPKRPHSGYNENIDGMNGHRICSEKTVTDCYTQSNVRTSG